MTFSVRDAISVEEVLPLVLEHTDYFGLPIDLTKTKNTLQFLIHSSDAKIFVLVDGDNKVQGYLCAMILEHFFMPGKTATELGFYCRAKGKGKDLIKAYELWVKESGVKVLALMSLHKNKDSVLLHNYYNKLGYTLFETSYIKVL